MVRLGETQPLVAGKTPGSGGWSSSHTTRFRPETQTKHVEIFILPRSPNWLDKYQWEIFRYEPIVIESMKWGNRAAPRYLSSFTLLLNMFRITKKIWTDSQFCVFNFLSFLIAIFNCGEWNAIGHKKYTPKSDSAPIRIKTNQPWGAYYLGQPFEIVVFYIKSNQVWLYGWEKTSKFNLWKIFKFFFFDFLDIFPMFLLCLLTWVP